MLELGDIKGIVRPEMVSVNDAVSSDFPEDNQYQGVFFNIGNHLGVNLAFAFETTEDGNLSGSTAAALSLSYAAEIRLVNRDFAVEKGRLYLCKMDKQ
jgi:hypothetical protein